ncbi:HutD family protein [Solibacillus sp. MA9]|uniref:HutD family protein n=1 Tax=Solibacillus palustris TaxID=2908203 RepID=A0ABS9UG31_9BACL|nr:HutD family protein [Solibacillus sp. MA9]MCH7323286.1 HutD family protein [Solibacillus sp. MA9]
MSYSIQLIRKNEQTTNEWSGGFTTQLAIYPEDADYKERNFKWRISSAIVELEESVFTSLPDINRLIMVIDGEMTLKHEGHHHVHLKPFEQDRFSGGWTTRSFGKVRDFNLMLSEGCNGDLEAITVEKGGYHETVNPNNPIGRQIAEAFYCITGPLQITIDDQEAIDVEEGDLLLLNSEPSETSISIKIINKAEAEANVIRASVIF